MYDHASGCFPQLDVLVHRLVTLLADVGDSKSAESRASDANLACRKLAVSHPVLLLRWKWLCLWFSCFLPRKMSKTCLSLSSSLQTSAYDCRSFTQSYSFKPAGVQTAEPHDLLQQRTRYSGAAAAARFPRWPPGGASGLSSLLHEGPSGGYLVLSNPVRCRI